MRKLKTKLDHIVADLLVSSNNDSLSHRSEASARNFLNKHDTFVNKGIDWRKLN